MNQMTALKLLIEAGATPTKIITVEGKNFDLNNFFFTVTPQRVYVRPENSLTELRYPGHFYKRKDGLECIKITKDVPEEELTQLLKFAKAKKAPPLIEKSSRKLKESAKSLWCKGCQHDTNPKGSTCGHSHKDGFTDIIYCDNLKWWTERYCLNSVRIKHPDNDSPRSKKFPLHGTFYCNELEQRCPLCSYNILPTMDKLKLTDIEKCEHYQAGQLSIEYYAREKAIAERTAEEDKIRRLWENGILYDKPKTRRKTTKKPKTTKKAKTTKVATKKAKTIPKAKTTTKAKVTPKKRKVTVVKRKPKK